MGLEVEIKAHASEEDVAFIRKVLSVYGEKEVEKDDRYYLRNSDNSRFRIRREANGAIIFTEKRTNSTGGFEANEEYEREITEDEIPALIADTHPYIRKHKKGFEWTIPETGKNPIHAELLYVNSLGWFLELEIIEPFDASSSIVADGHDREKKLLSQLGVISKIEPRKYSEMIIESEHLSF